MDLEQFQDFTARRSCRIVKNNAFGVCQGYPFAVSLHKGMQSLLDVSFWFGAKAPGKVFRELRRAMKPFKASAMHPAPNRLGFMLSCRGEDTEQKFDDALAAAVAVFAAAGLSAPVQCPICHRAGCDTLAVVGGGYVPVHRACLDAALARQAESAQRSLTGGNYFTGVLGALLGAMVGALPSLLTIWFLSRAFGLLFALIPIGAYQGYKLCRGRLNRAATAVAVVVSVLQVFVLEQALFYIAIVTQLDYWPNVLESVGYYFQVMSFGDMIGDMAVPLLFVGLGIWVAWRMISQTGATALQGVDFANATAEAWNGAPAAPAAPADRDQTPQP